MAVDPAAIADPAEPVEPAPVNPPAMPAPDLQAQLDDAQRATARERALRQYPYVTEELLSSVSGTPDQIMAYAKNLHDNVASHIPAPTTPAPQPAPGSEPVPTPVPGVGAVPAPGDQAQARMEDLTDAVINKTATRGVPFNPQRGPRTETEELFNLSIIKGVNELNARNGR